MVSQEEHMLDSSDGSGSNFFDLGRVNFLWLGSGRVRAHLYWIGLDSARDDVKLLTLRVKGKPFILLGSVLADWESV